MKMLPPSHFAALWPAPEEVSIARRSRATLDWQKFQQEWQPSDFQGRLLPSQTLMLRPLREHPALIAVDVPMQSGQNGAAIGPCGNISARHFYIPRVEGTMRKVLIGAAAILALASSAGRGQSGPDVEACRTTGLIALKETNPAITDIWLDMDGLTVAKANTKIEDTPIRTVIIGEAYLDKGKNDTRRTFLCLIGEKGKVLLTFFTEK